MKRILSLFLIVSSVAGMHAYFSYPDEASKEDCQEIRYPRGKYGISPSELKEFEEFKQKCEAAGYNPEIKNR